MCAGKHCGIQIHHHSIVNNNLLIWRPSKMDESTGMCLSETDEMSRNEDPFSMRIKNWLDSVIKFSFRKLTSIGIGE